LLEAVSATAGRSKPAVPEFTGRGRFNDSDPESQLTFRRFEDDKPTMSTKTATRRAAAKWKSRAVVRNIEAGSSTECAFCGERVKFQAKIRMQQVICNVYVNGHWDRVEHYHAECYTLVGELYGSPA
jgi:hypothetical protein